MATFPNIVPDQGSDYAKEFRINRSQFGDGYSQRSANGINFQIRTLNLSWSNRPIADINTIKSFLDAQGGFTVFEYTPVGEATELKWSCSGYNDPPGNGAYATISATFVQEFDL